MKRAYFYMTSVALATLMPAGIAAAQTASDESAATAIQDDESAVDSGDIVVTAQRRSQRLVDVPVSVTALTSEALASAGITAIDTATKLAPGVVINRNGAYLQPTIRGIGTNSTGPGADPNVAIYIDGVYQSSQTGNIFDLPNVDQIEILKGPQGTLFGRNATGGAILISTLKPSFETKVKANISYGRFNEVRSSAYLSSGITDTLAADLAVYYRHSDGWIRDMRTGVKVNDQYSFDIRSKLLWTPTDNLTVTLGLAHNETSDPTGLAFASAEGNSAGRPLPNSGPIADERGELSHNLLPEIRFKADSVTLNAALDLDFATLSSITAYRRENAFIASDLDSSYAAPNYSQATYHQKFRNTSQEFNLTSTPGGAFNWVLGAFYMHERAALPDFYMNNATGSIPFLRSQITTDAYAGYFDGTYDLGDFSIIGGIRYSTEKKSFEFGNPGGAYTGGADKRFSSWTPRAGLRYKLSNRSNVYATFSRGFKSGTFNTSSRSTAAVNPEKVDAYEVGFKSSSSVLTFNSAAYYYKYDDIQVTAFDYNGGISRLINAAKAEIYGFDMDGTVHIGSRLDIRAAFAYTHSEYTSFPGANSFTPIAPGNVGNVGTIIDASGAPLLRAPKYTASGSVTYRLPVGDGEVAFSATPYWSSRINYSVDERISQAAYFTLDGNIAWKPNENLKISVFAQNLTDKKYASFRTSSALRDGILYAQPRTYGVAFGYNF